MRSISPATDPKLSASLVEPRYDVIIVTDLHMPVLNGLDLIYSLSRTAKDFGLRDGERRSQDPAARQIVSSSSRSSRSS